MRRRCSERARHAEGHGEPPHYASSGRRHWLGNKRKLEGAPVSEHRIRTMSLVLLISSSLSGCGTLVPQVGEIWDDNSGKSAHDLEMKIKTKIYCELQSAVSYINDPKEREPFQEWYRGKERDIKPLPDSWGVQMTISLTVEESTNLNPGISFNTPMIPGTTFFPNKITVPGPQSYNFGLGGTLSSDATRTDKFTFYYLVKDLEGVAPSCSPDVRDPQDLHGSSLLLESDLGIKKWLNNAMNIRTSLGVSEPVQQEVISYDVKFDIVSSGSATPTWKLVRVTTGNGGANLFSTKRERTHELMLTFGPTQPPSPSMDKLKKKQPAQPGTLATNDALAQQIGSAVAIAVKNALSP
jgi:hypothetical protein